MSVDAALAHYTPIFQEYTEYHNAVMNDRDRERNFHPQYVIISPIAALSNRMRFLVAGVIYAIVTRRIVILSGFGAGYQAQFSDLFAPVIQVERNVATGSAYNVVLEQYEDMFCGDHLQHVKSIQTVRFHGYDFFVPELYLQPSFRQAYQAKLGRWDGEVFAYVYKHFFPYKLQLQSQIDEYVRSQFAGHYMVGMHIRSGGDFQEGMNEQDWSNYKLCADALIPPEERHRVRFFAAVDTQAARDKATSIWGDQNIVFFKNFLISDTPLGCQQAAIDQALVALCDLLVVTPASSFSETSALLSYRKPAFFTNIRHGLYWYNKDSPYWVGEACRTPQHMQMSQEPILKHRLQVSCQKDCDPVVLHELLD